MAFFGFEFHEGQEIVGFAFDRVGFDELLAEVPYPFTHDTAGEISFDAQSRVFYIVEKWGKGIVPGHPAGPATDLPQPHSHA